jgi:hypothetical protein
MMNFKNLTLSSVTYLGTKQAPTLVNSKTILSLLTPT